MVRHPLLTIAAAIIGIITPPIIHRSVVISAFSATPRSVLPTSLPFVPRYDTTGTISTNNEERNTIHNGQIRQRRIPSRIQSSGDSTTEETAHAELSHGDDNGPAAPERIYILGGGFGGLNTALTLASLPWSSTDGGTGDGNGPQRPVITLVDRKERFVFLPLLYELCVGDAELEEVAPTFQSLLKDTNVEFLQREIEGVDVENSKVYLSSPAADTNQEGLSYDKLVIATGADVDLSFISGAQTYAIPFYTVEDCFELRRTLALFESVAAGEGPSDGAGEGAGADGTVVNVVVVGGGYSGVELALNVSERLKQSYEKVEVTLVHRGDEILQYATEYNRKTGLDRLQKAGVTLRTGSSVVDVAPLDDAPAKFPSGYLNERCCRVTLQPKGLEGITTNVIPADLLLWTAGASSANVPKGVLNSVLPRDSNGRIVTDTLLRTGTTPGTGGGEIFALGDRARVAGRAPYGATAQVAIQQAAVASWNIYASVSNRAPDGNGARRLEPLPFGYLDLGEMLTLGGEDASVTSLDGLVRLDGVGASVLRRLIYAVRMPTAQQALTAAVKGAEKRVEGLVARRRRGRNDDSMKKKSVSWR